MVRCHRHRADTAWTWQSVASITKATLYLLPLQEIRNTFKHTPEDVLDFIPTTKHKTANDFLLSSLHLSERAHFSSLLLKKTQCDLNSCTDTNQLPNS